MNNYKHTDAAIEAAKEYGDPRGYYSESDFLRGVEWTERWIPVGYETPAYLNPFLAICDGIACIGMLYEVEDGIACISVNGSQPILFFDAGFTHWKHLPNPPQT